MRSFRLFALMLVMAAVGCAQSRLFSRSGARDDDEPPPQSSSAADESPLNAARDRELEPRASGLNRELIRPQASSLPIAELLERAEQARQAARWPEVQRYSEAIIQQQPAHPRAHHLLAVIADLEGRFGDAEHHYNAALQSDPQNAAIIGDLGYSYLLQGRLALAEQYLLRARAIDPGNVNVSKNLAVLCSQSSDLTGAQQALANVYPPDKMLQILTPLFPGVPAEVLLGQAVPNGGGSMPYGQPPANAASQTEFATVRAPTGGAVGVDPFARSAPQYQAAMVASPPIGGAPSNVVPQFSSAMPVIEPQGTNAMLYAGVDPNAQIMMVNPAGTTTPAVAPNSPTGIAQASASVPSPAWANGGASPAAVTAPATRRWPPALWPPQSTTQQPPAAVPQAAMPTPASSGVTSPAPMRPSSGVTYLMPRRPATPAVPPVNQFAPDQPSTGAPNPSWPGTNQVPPARDAAAAPYAADPQAQYATGPGASRIVTWPNRNGLSLDQPPLPPTSEQSAPNINVPAISAPAPLRSSPGAASGWNGGLYPPPERQLSSTGPAKMEYSPQGVPMRLSAPAPQGAPASSPAGPGTIAANAPPHAGFMIAPSAATPENPLAGYEADRRQFDQRFQEQVERTYGRSPSGFIPPPSANMPTPRYEVPGAPAAGAPSAPLSAGGTPWPSTSQDSTAAGQARAGGSVTANGTAAPPPLYRPRTGTTQSQVPPYRRPAPLNSGAPYYETPSIVPNR